MRKTRLIIYLCLILVFMHTNIYAATTDDLYELYSVSVNHSISQNVLDTITRRYNAERTVMSYVNVITIDDLNGRQLLKPYEDKVIELELKLNNSYDLGYDETILLEHEYIQAMSDLQNKRNSIFSSIETKEISIDKIPSLQEYSDALVSYKTYVANKDIGSISELKIPVDNSDIVYHSNNYTQFASAIDDSVYALFNGTVSEVSGSEIIITSTDNIITKYTGINSTNLNVGDVVHQNDIIGTSLGTVRIGLMLDKTPVDIYKIIRKE